MGLCSGPLGVGEAARGEDKQNHRLPAAGSQVPGVTSEAEAGRGCWQLPAVTELMPTSGLSWEASGSALGPTLEPPQACSGGRLGLMGSESNKRPTLLFQL